MSEHVCSVDGCVRPVQARGWCSGHWARWRKHGDPLAGTPLRRMRRPGAICEVVGCDRPNQAGGYCGAHYARVRRYGDPLAGTPQQKNPQGSERARVLAEIRAAYEVAPSGMDGAVLALVQSYCKSGSGDDCWEWPMVTKSGYGRMNLMHRRSIRMHRLTVEFATGYYVPLRAAEIVHHKCANRAFCNPAHLQVVDTMTNLAESVERNTYKNRIRELEAKLAELTEAA